MYKRDWTWLWVLLFPVLCVALRAIESDEHKVAYIAYCNNQPTIECTSRTRIVPMYNTMVGRGSVCIDSVSARIKRVSIERMHVDIRIDSSGVHVNGRTLIEGGI